MSATERMGSLVGRALAPLAGGVSLLRRARVFHPEGVVYHARVEPLHTEGPLGDLARRVAGDALARLSGAWWRVKERPDVLGLALRLRAVGEASATPADGDQDLLFATIRSPWTTLAAALSTHQHDFLDNDYFGVAPFEIEGVGRVKLRLVGPRPGTPGTTRAERLDRDVSAGRADLRLEARRLDDPALADEWLPVALLRLVEPARVDQERLEFSPFRAGRGIRPVGFVHALRRGTYGASQAMRHLVE